MEGDRDLNERGADAQHLTEDDRTVPVTDKDALATFMESLDQSVLPDLPKMPGFHVCWLTTNNLRDSIAHRERIGYVPIRRSELRGWETPNLQTAAGDKDDYVRVNEMVAYKLPMRLYDRYMRELHHNKPLAEEEKLRARVDQAKEQLQQVGSRVSEIGDGTDEIVQRTRQEPRFAE